MFKEKGALKKKGRKRVKEWMPGENKKKETLQRYDFAILQFLYPWGGDHFFLEFS